MSISAILLLAGGVGVASALAVKSVQAWAVRRALFDIPNDRSSHKAPVPRLGGAAFVPVLLLGILLATSGFEIGSAALWPFLLGSGALFLLGLVDDLRPLSSLLRIGVQAGVVIGFFWRVFPPDSAALNTGTWPVQVSFGLSVLWVVFFLNVYNFMDGIDGLAGLQATVAGLAWAIAGWWLAAPLSLAIGAAMAAAALGFLTLNWHPARVFMGDAGSTVLGYAVAALPFIAAAETPPEEGKIFRLFGAGVLCAWPFVADGGFTIARRLLLGENILKAHRSHLYQRLVISGVPHRTVTLFYGAGAAMMATLGIWALSQHGRAIWILAVGIGLLEFVAVWLWTLRRERRPRET